MERELNKTEIVAARVDAREIDSLIVQFYVKYGFNNLFLLKEVLADTCICFRICDR